MNKGQPTLFDLGPKTSKFLEYHETNPQIWKAFSRKTFQTIDRGFRQFGAKAILEIIRWETGVAADGADGFKVNNTYAPYYARLFAVRYPEHKDFFRMRESAADDEIHPKTETTRAR